MNSLLPQPLRIQTYCNHQNKSILVVYTLNRPFQVHFGVTNRRCRRGPRAVFAEGELFREEELALQRP